MLSIMVFTNYFNPQFYVMYDLYYSIDTSADIWGICQSGY